MVERFDTYYGSISCKSTVRHIHANGEFVLATDYTKLEARLASIDQKFIILQGSHDLLAKERDSLALRINPDGTPVDIAALCMEIDTVTDERDEWKRRCERLVLTLSEHGYTPEAVAHIAEGRDNG